MKKNYSFRLSAMIVAGSLALSACSSEEEFGQPPKHEGGVPEVTAAPEQSESHGTVSELQLHNSVGVTDEAQHGFVAGLDSEKSSLILAPFDQLDDSSAVKVSLGEPCSALARGTQGVVLGCNSAVRGFDSQGRQIFSFDVDQPVESLVQLSDGTIALHSGDDTSIVMYTTSGVEQKTASTGDKSVDDLLLVNSSGSDSIDHIIVVDNEQSALTDISSEDYNIKGALRVGQGIGLASGSGHDIVLATDTVQNQFLLFTANDMIRQHQSSPTGISPFAITWDETHSIAWVSTTGDNKVTAYSVDTGVPVPVAQFDSIANVRQMFSLPEGLVLRNAQDQVQTVAYDELEINIQ